MCSACSPTDQAARDRVLDVAVDLIGREGVRAATVRRIADAAGVSPPLVMHHFGSKEGLVAACDERMLRVVEDAMATFMASGAETGVQSFLAIPGAIEAIVYIGRSMQDGGAAGTTWFQRMVQLTITGLEQMEESGMVNRAADPIMRAVLLVAMDLGLVLLRPMIEAQFATSITDPALVERWLRTEFDLLNQALFAERGTPA